MSTVPQVSQAIQSLLGEEADQLAWETNFNQRTSAKLSGSAFVRGLVFCILEDADLSYRQLSQGALDAGVEISPQGLEQRFNSFSVCFLEKMLEASLGHVLSGTESVFPILKRFSSLLIRDSSVISLPEELAPLFPGVGNKKGASAALKLQVRLDYKSGQLGGPVVVSGREHDTRSPFQDEPAEAGVVKMGDLGYFSLAQFQKDAQAGGYFFSRYKVGTNLYEQAGNQIDLVRFLQAETSSQFEIPISLGKKMHLPARLIVERVPQEVADQRRHHLKEYARKKQVALSPESLALAEWTLILTNIPEALLSIPEALLLLRVRWQIELLFRLWKSLFKLDEWRSQKPYRILTEVFAKLLAVVILHWTFLLDLWAIPQHSLWKAALTVRRFATSLAVSFTDQAAFQAVLQRIQEHFQHVCHLDRRKTHPSTASLLEAAAMP